MHEIEFGRVPYYVPFPPLKHDVEDNKGHHDPDIAPLQVYMFIIWK
jgi:hypothetical protein